MRPKNSIQPPFAGRELECGPRFQSEGTQTRDECEIEIRILIIVWNVQKSAFARTAPHSRLLFCSNSRVQRRLTGAGLGDLMRSPIGGARTHGTKHEYARLEKIVSCG